MRPLFLSGQGNEVGQRLESASAPTNLFRPLCAQALATDQRRYDAVNQEERDIRLALTASNDLPLRATSAHSSRRPFPSCRTKRRCSYIIATPFRIGGPHRDVSRQPVRSSRTRCPSRSGRLQARQSRPPSSDASNFGTDPAGLAGRQTRRSHHPQAATRLATRSVARFKFRAFQSRTRVRLRTHGPGRHSLPQQWPRRARASTGRPTAGPHAARHRSEASGPCVARQNPSTGSQDPSAASSAPTVSPRQSSRHLSAHGPPVPRAVRVGEPGSKWAGRTAHSAPHSPGRRFSGPHGPLPLADSRGHTDTAPTPAAVT